MVGFAGFPIGFPPLPVGFAALPVGFAVLPVGFAALPVGFAVLVERSSSVVECRTRNRESPGSNPLYYRFEVWAFSFSLRRLSRLSCINEYLAIDRGGNVSE